MKMILPLELYNAARETCLRLFVANGGDPQARWTIRPYPGTAAISCHRPYGGGPAHYTLCMPAMPLDVRVPRWQADLIAAYTVHELLHALWTDWDVVRQSKVEGLGNLCNAIEDNRIEAKAARDLVNVSEAKRLLVALNAHIAHRAMTTPGFALDSAPQFSFVLGLVIFAEKLGYASDLPANWRSHVKPEWLPLIDLALARFDGLRSTADSLQLCHDLKALAAKLAKPATPRVKLPALPGMPSPDAMGPQSREPEIVENDDTELNDPSGAPQGTPQEPAGGEDDDGGRDDAPDAPKPANEPEDGDDDDDKGDAGAPGDGDASAGGRGSSGEVNAPAEDVTDMTQSYQEAHLNDLSEQAAKNAGKSVDQIDSEGQTMSTILNAPTMSDLPRDKYRNANPQNAGAVISSPAKLRRHLTLAVKSPERVGTERRQTSGRLDMRNLVGMAIASPTVFRRRVEEEGREVAVTILLDVSSSMKGTPLAAAKAMALHMGDALKAAGVKFEVCGFDDSYLTTPKPFAKGWGPETQRAVAGMYVLNGTAMLPAMKQCGERLLKVGNVTRRILLTLTDGADSYSTDANVALCRWLRARGVECVGIGLMTWGVKQRFDGRAVEVMNTHTLSTEGLKALVTALGN